MAKGDWKNKGFGKAFAAGAIKGGTVGSVIPGLGTGVGALVGGIGGMLKQRKANKEGEELETTNIEQQEEDQSIIDAEALAKENEEKRLQDAAIQKAKSTVPGMKPAYGSPVFNPATQQTMGALSGANPGADPSLPYQGGENALLENALSGLYS